MPSGGKAGGCFTVRAFLIRKKTKKVFGMLLAGAAKE
jgi:hypothetical protein